MRSHRTRRLGLRSNLILGHLAIVAFALTPVFAGDAGCLEYAKPGTTVTGYLLRLEFQAPTYTGKSVPLPIWQVRRIEPFCVAARKLTGDLPMEGASIVELFAGPEFETLLRSLDGKRVTVEGELMPTYIPHYHPELIMKVTSIHEAK